MISEVRACATAPHDAAALTMGERLDRVDRSCRHAGRWSNPTLPNPVLSVVVPAFNEARTILRTLADLREHLERRSHSYEIIVAADGTDGTREKVAELGRTDARLSVLGSPERRGKGRGIRLAVARARGEIVGFTDADGKTPAEEMDRLLPWLDEGYDLVIGSRGVPGSRLEVLQPLHRRIGSRAFGVALHLLLGLWDIRDTQCGFKFFRGPVARDLFGRQRIDGYMFDVEILHLAERCGYRIKEVGVRWRDDADSRLDLVSGNWQNMIDMLRIRFDDYGRPRQTPARGPEAAPGPAPAGNGDTL
jgi:glycosyltransferase involved in cell wall biosynthesis